MSVISSKPWSKYAVTADNTELLSEVYHVSHIETATRIAKDKKMRAGLVNDESILRTKRVLVNWLSPNDWYHGYRYGNVRFAFDFNKIVKHRRIYWVEVMEDYRPVACRLLVTLHEHEDILPYDPASDSGPLLYVRKENKYYWNRTICLEIMTENDLSLSRCAGVKFVKHHGEMCCFEAKTCKELGMTARKAAVQFCSYMMANDLDIKPELFTLRINGVKPRTKSGEFEQAIERIINIARKALYSGKTVLDPLLGEILIKATLNYLANGNAVHFKEAIGIFTGFDEFSALFLKMIGERLALTDVWKEFEEEE
jgi:hypothetical protein